MAFDPSIIGQVINAEYIDALPGLITEDLGYNILNLLVYVIGMVIYAIVIWHFYQHLGKKTIFKLDIPEPGYVQKIQRMWNFLNFLITSMVVFPFISFLWFLILSGSLLVLSKSYNVAQTLLMSMTIIATSRITAYYNENLSMDLAKMIPFALLGVFIVDPTFFSIKDTIEKFYSIPNNIHLIIQYLISIVLLEFILRSYSRIRNWINKEKFDKVD
ncbi:hypothetical protein JXB41_04890 [Candidatus Woesearchaeota archaeon]|nr:hypothetical protein [Candidatus Woesearchaeota archaeon]